MPFIPTTQEEVRKRGWKELDVVFVSGDAYIDHPAFGVPLLARWLESHGFRVGIISQPDWRSKEPFMALGRPLLFFAVSAGAMDSMVAHYTPARKLRQGCSARSVKVLSAPRTSPGRQDVEAAPPDRKARAEIFSSAQARSPNAACIPPGSGR